jgi:hypothetical protein
MLREQARVLDLVLFETGRTFDDVEEVRGNPRVAAGDADALRGLPAVGVRGGRGGTMPGTNPLAALLAKEREGRRRL